MQEGRCREGVGCKETHELVVQKSFLVPVGNSWVLHLRGELGRVTRAAKSIGKRNHGEITEAKHSRCRRSTTTRDAELQQNKKRTTLYPFVGVVALHRPRQQSKQQKWGENQKPSSTTTAHSNRWSRSGASWCAASLNEHSQLEESRGTGPGCT